MKKSVLKFDKASDNHYHAIIKNNHGRKIYLKVNLSGKTITICDCFYIDRPMRNGNKAIPLKLRTLMCTTDSFLNVLADELDKKFFGIEFSHKETNMSSEEYIIAMNQKTKYKFLILIESNDILKTRLKNRIHRSIYLEIEKKGSKGLIRNCHYCDRYYKRNKHLVTPTGLNTIYFDYSFENLLQIVNNELNCDFTDILIAGNTFGFDKSEIPVCGSI